jgi:hypothetical protein
VVAAFGDECSSEQSERQRPIEVLAGTPDVAREPEDGPSDRRTQRPEDQRARASADPLAELRRSVVADGREDERREPGDDRASTARHRSTNGERDEQPRRDWVGDLRPSTREHALQDLRRDTEPEADDQTDNDAHRLSVPE